MDEGALRIAVVSDTHSAPHERADARLAELAPHAILHGGDVGDLSVLDALAKRAPVIAVRGNVDGHVLPDFVTIDVRGPEGSLLVILLTHWAVQGPLLRPEIARLAAKEGASLVVCGHSHLPLIAQDRSGVAVFNPGSIGPRRFRLPIALGVIEVTRAEGVRLRHIDCETGSAWRP